jgi:hypothetical protein
VDQLAVGDPGEESEQGWLSATLDASVGAGTTSGSDTGGLAGSGKLGSAKKLATVTAGEASEGGFGRPGGGGDRGWERTGYAGVPKFWVQ